MTEAADDWVQRSLPVTPLEEKSTDRQSGVLPSADAKGTDDGFVDLFNGKDLTGWSYVIPGGNVMTGKPPRDRAATVRGRLMNCAKQNGERLRSNLCFMLNMTNQRRFGVGPEEITALAAANCKAIESARE